MDDLLYKAQKWMIGRNGPDAFGTFLLITGWLISIVNIFTRSLTVRILSFLMIAYAVYRFCSKNVVKRRIENTKYQKIERYIRRSWKAFSLNLKDKNYKYHVCKNCCQLVRVPRGHGRVTITCPGCRNQFDARS